MYILTSAAIAAVALAYGVVPAPAPSKSAITYVLEAEKTYVYCAYGKTTIETWDLEQMKVRYGPDTCLLFTETVQTSAEKWMAENFPSGECSC